MENELKHRKQRDLVQENVDESSHSRGALHQMFKVADDHGYAHVQQATEKDKGDLVDTGGHYGA